jgi:leucyl aminopeptidase
VIDDRRLKAMKMGAMLAVGGGSASKPRMIILEHRGSQRSGKPIVLVGKAVTLDSGGYSLKPAASIPEMKYDKCGGMAVLGVMIAAATMKIRRRVIGVIGAVENMISGEAYRPGDIVRAANGKTIEILSTDAEGRLVLADCLYYAEKTFDPAVLIDIATLTGACKVSLGETCAAVLSNNDEVAAALVESGERTNERLWRMPLWAEYREPMVGTDSDLKNTGGPNGGTMTAAMFLKEFVGDKTAWAHLDIAGVANIAKQTPICPIGATGFGVRLLVDYIERMK